MVPSMNATLDPKIAAMSVNRCRRVIGSPAVAAPAQRAVLWTYRWFPENYRPVENSQIADRLESFAVLLELADANPYTARAYRRAAETIRAAAVPVKELVASGRSRQLRGIGPGIEARLRELVETGEIAELSELERELAPDLVGLGRYLGL